MGKIPVGATIAQAYRFAFGSFLKILGVIWLPMIVMWLPGLLMQHQMQAVAAHDLSAIRQMLPVLLLFYGAAFILCAMLMIGIGRLALGLPTGSPWFYFSLGMPVWRLLGSWLLLLMVAIIGVLVILLGGFLLRAALAAVPGVQGIVSGLGTLALWCGFLYCLTRLSFLLTPMTVERGDEEGLSLARAWTLGRGNFWRMFAVSIVAVLPFLMLEGAIILSLFHGVGFPHGPATADQAAAFQASIQANTATFTHIIYQYWYLTFPVMLAVMVIFYGVWVSAKCFAYRALADQARL